MEDNRNEVIDSISSYKDILSMMKLVIHEVANEAGSKDEANNGKEQVGESWECMSFMLE